MKEKIITIIFFVIILLSIFFGIGIAKYQVEQINNSPDIIATFKIDFKVWGIFMLVLIVEAILAKIFGEGDVAITLYLSVIAYLITLAIFIIIESLTETSNVFMIIFMLIVTLLMHGLPFAFVALIPLGAVMDSGEKSSKKTKNISATTFNWSKNWSTTTYKDEDGNETKIDHWKF